jgi:DNA modification methylase
VERAFGEISAENATVDVVEASAQPRDWAGAPESTPEWRIINGEAFRTLRSLPSDSVSCVVTSPPYFWLRNYGVEGQYGLEDDIAGYVENVTSALIEAARVMKPSGLLFLNIGDTFYSGKGKSHGTDKKSAKRRFGLRAVDRSGGMGIGLQRKSQIGIPWRVAMSLMASGLTLRSSIIWHRKNCLPESVKDRPSRSYEYVFMFSKSRYYHFSKAVLRDHDFDQDVWSISAKSKVRSGIDTAPFPDELVRRCLQIGCEEGGTVLDPFVGSGTTVRVAHSMGLHSLGIELNAEFCEYAARQMSGV